MEENYNKSIIDLFKNPPNEFRMMPFWFWNHEIVEKEVIRQIKDHFDHGIGGEFIHPRHGRLTPYMGTRWLENVEAAAEKCKELGMWCFLYDEDNWPSGPVSGLITGPDNPENRGKFLVLFDEEIFNKGESVEYNLDFKEISEETQFFAAIAVPNPKNYPNFSDVFIKRIDVSDKVKGNKFIWKVPDNVDEWLVLFFCICLNDYHGRMCGYIDPLRKETVKQFIELTHKKYIEYFKKRGKENYIGTIVPGIFTDEPSMWHVQIPNYEFLRLYVYSPELPNVFMDMHGYSVKDALIPLFYDVGDETAKYRCHYWETATKMYVDAFYKQIFEFCDKYNFRTTGHVNAEGAWPNHFRHQGDFFKLFEYMHYGGCDQLTEEVRPDYFEDIFNLNQEVYKGMANEMLTASKLASSAAHLLGKPRVLVEAFGTSSWDITMANAKRINDYLIATGCDLFVPHDFAYSEDGYRKQDHPASFYHQPYYKHWKKLCDHSARLCALLNAHNGNHIAEALILYPTNMAYAEFNGSDSNILSIAMKHYIHTADCLFRQQIDFDFANEDLIKNGKIIKLPIKEYEKSTNVKENKEICMIELGKGKIKERFKLICLGATTCVSLEFAKKLKEFYINGGKIIASMVLPFKDKDKGVSPELIEIIQEIFGINSKEYFEKVINAQKDKIKEFKIYENSNSQGGLAIFIETGLKIPYYGNFYPLFEKSCRKLIPLNLKDICIFKDEKDEKYAAYIMSLHRSIGLTDFDLNEFDELEKKFINKADLMQHLYFFTNSSNQANYEKCVIKIRIPTSIDSGVPKKIELLDTLNGTVINLTKDDFWIEMDSEFKNRKIVLILDFPPYKSYLFRIIYESLPHTDEFNIRDQFKIWASKTFKFAFTENISKKPKPINIIDLGSEWKIKLNNPNVAMLNEKWEASYFIEAKAAWGYHSTRIFSHKFHISDLKEIIKEQPINLVIDGLTGDYAWGKTTYMTLEAGDKTSVNLKNLKFLVNDNLLTFNFNFDYIYLDPCWIVVNITKYLREGMNEVKMICTTNNHETFHVVTDPWRLIGKFECEMRNGIPYLKKSREMVNLGDLCPQGFGRYHGGFSYIKEVIIPPSTKGKKFILLIENTTDTIDVIINDKYIDTLWNFWELDISSSIEIGKANKIELIYYGIAQNTLQTNLKSFGLKGKILLKIFL